MHFQLTDPQILSGVFVLALGLIFAIAALAQSRVKKPPPFHNYFCSKYDRNLFPPDSFSAPEDILVNQPTVFPDLDGRYSDSSEH